MAGLLFTSHPLHGSTKSTWISGQLSPARIKTRLARSWWLLITSRVLFALLSATWRVLSVRDPPLPLLCVVSSRSWKSLMHRTLS